MKEFILSRAQMLALMTAVDTGVIPGLDNDRLVPDTQMEQREMALAGIEELKANGLLRQEEDDTHILDGDLGLMAAAIAYPQVVTLVTRDEPGKGQQQFLHYRADPVHAELTMPTANTYRLAAIPDTATALARVRQILPVTREQDALAAGYQLTQEEFLQAKSHAEAGKMQAATAVLTAAGFAADHAAAFAQALHQPTLGGTVAYMTLEQQEIVDGRNLAMVKNDTAAWLIQQPTPTERVFAVQTVTAVAYSNALLAMLTDLLQPAPGS